ncbi:MAG: beta-N-acetylhexosaminidase [Chitinophagaceae bacterium]|nr:beta-N-acetylhexosaminidase [Chitinophagaceae bacterium]
MKAKLITFLFFFFSLSSLFAQQLNIIPVPVSYTVNPGSFTIDKNTIILVNGEKFDNAAYRLQEYILRIYAMDLKVIDFETSKQVRLSNTVAKIRLAYDEAANTTEGAYNLTVEKDGITITAQNANGIFYGTQTLLQLLPPQKNVEYKLPFVQITDYPRFTYRGIHLDVGRHFFPVSFIKTYIDYLAFHKFNTFHWHLTEDQGWRIEIKKYPRLTEIGSCRAQTLVGNYGSNKYDGEKYCGFYTQEEIKEVVKYATERYINVIPEIEVPGHSVAALASYTYLGCTKGPYKTYETWGVTDDVYCAGNDSTFVFLEGVLDEVVELFPSSIIHIGGDECPKERWKHCSKCQQRMKDNNLKDELELQSYFIQRIGSYLKTKGKSIIGWDEILEGGIAANATIMSWRGEEGGIAAAKQKHNVIMTPGGWCYFDHSQSRNEDSITFGGYTPLEKTYSYEPIPKELNSDEAKYILGAQGNLWTEYITNPSKIEYQVFPRMSALSEVVWSPKDKRDWKSFEARIPTLFKRYQLWGAHYSNAYYDLKSSVVPVKNQGIGWMLETKNASGKVLLKKNHVLLSPADIKEPISVRETSTLSATLIDENQKPISSKISQKFYINKASGKKVKLLTETAKNYSGLGGFTLVDGVQNTRGMARSFEFLGFKGNNLEAIIDLGKMQLIKSISLHSFEQQASWIYLPKEVQFYSSADGKKFKLIKAITQPAKADNNIVYKTTAAAKTKYIKVIAQNVGIIPDGQPGAGNPAWLFVDEVEIK